MGSPAAATRCWVFLKELIRTQAGRVFIVAEATLQPDGCWYYVSPYVLRAVKAEEKARVHAAQARLAAGYHADNSMLERALLISLQNTEARDSVVKLFECWHDEHFVYSLLEYLAGGDLFEVAQGKPGTDPPAAGASSAHHDLSSGGAGAAHRHSHHQMRSISGRPLSAQSTPASSHLYGGSHLRVPPGVDESTLRTCTKDVLHALHMLHSLGFVHRDLSPENVMFDAGNRGRLIDFGAALPMVQDPVQQSAATTARLSAPVQLGSRQSSSATATSALTAVSVPASARSSDDADDEQMTDSNSSAAASAADASNGKAGSEARPSSISIVRASSLQELKDRLVLQRGSSTGSLPYQTPTAAPPSISGWLPFPPALPPPFCKPAYACPNYMWGRHWWGVQYDLFSLGATLFAAVDGRQLYHMPAASDRRFMLLLETERYLAHQREQVGSSLCVGPGPEMGTLQLSFAPAAGGAVGAAGAASSRDLGGPASQQLTPFAAFLVQYSNLDRPATGRAPLSPLFIDLLLQLLRVTPSERPFSARDVLKHPWFRMAKVAPADAAFEHAFAGLGITSRNTSLGSQS